MQDEKERHKKYRKQDEEREVVRQSIRDKVGIMMVVLFREDVKKEKEKKYGIFYLCSDPSQPDRWDFFCSRFLIHVLYITFFFF